MHKPMRIVRRARIAHSTSILSGDIVSRKIILSTAVLVAMTGAAAAADLPSSKGAPDFAPPAPPAFSWSGFYIGANAGISTGEDSLSVTAPAVLGGSEGFRANSGGFSGGGQIGYNFEVPSANVVLGVEADFQGSTQRADYEDVFGAGLEEAIGTKLNWWGTARGRIGYAFGNILPYITGGFAYGHATDFINFSGVGIGAGSEEFSWSSTRTGWTAGAGVEYAITHNLTAKIEYLYTDLGSFSNGVADFGAPVAENFDTRIVFHTVRAGLNWKFDLFEPPAPVVAKY
jgi:outer membrane immunogenic protein